MIAPAVELRRFPYPYRAMLAICSDLDETPDAHVYLEIARFLNTTQETSMGSGLGIEVGNSIYFDMPPDQFAYWNTDQAGRDMVRALIRSGHIDCLHSYGDLAVDRSYAGRALDELARHDCRLEVWIDHGTAATNFGADRMCGHGDEPGRPAYHADLTLGAGVRYVWRGRVTSVIGQDVRGSLGGIFNTGHPLASARTVGKEAVKQVVGRLGCRKYRAHAGNRLMRPVRLRDGQTAREFLRCNPHWGGVSSCEEGRAIEHVLTPGFLERLGEREGCCLLYTHLGKVYSRQRPFSPAGTAALGRLAAAHHDGRILVSTTRRLLRYRQVAEEIRFTSRDSAEGLVIALQPGADGPLDAETLAGLTFYVPDSASARISINGQTIGNLRRNPADHTGKMSVSIPWTPLCFPNL